MVPTAFSPFTYRDDYVYLVEITGDTNYDDKYSIDVSYGSISPDLTYPDAYYIDRGGDTYSRYYVTGSYGKQISPSTGGTAFAWQVYPSGFVNYSGNDFVYDSYGINKI